MNIKQIVCKKSYQKKPFLKFPLIKFANHDINQSIYQICYNNSINLSLQFIVSSPTQREDAANRPRQDHDHPQHQHKEPHVPRADAVPRPPAGITLARRAAVRWVAGAHLVGRDGSRFYRTVSHGKPGNKSEETGQG